MMPVRAWAIWYDDDTTFSSEDGSWEDAPREGVQVVCFRHDPPYRTFVTGRDEYLHPEHGGVKYGRWMDDDAFDVLNRIAETEG